MVNQAVVLVGGKGTRLGHLTAQIPKPLLPIQDDKRFLDYLIQRLVLRGFNEIVLIAGHLGHQFQSRYGKASVEGASVKVVVEPQPAGTGGALACAREHLAETFLMLNGDSLFDFDFRALIPALSEEDIGALALRNVDDGRRYGAVTFEEGRVTAFSEKDPALVGPATISGGVYLIRKAILELIQTLPCSIEAEVFPVLVAQARLGAAKFDGYFIDIGLPETLQRARTELPNL